MRRRTAVCGALAAVLSHGVSARLQAASAPNGEPVHHTVEIRQFRFSPATLTVRPGDRITWINLDIVPHTATAIDESWDTGELAMNASADVVVSEALDANYFCRFHPHMKARFEIATSG